MTTMTDAKAIVDFTLKWLAEQLEQEVSADANFAALGLDSLDAVRLTDDLAALIGVEELPVSLILDHPTANALGEHLVKLQASENAVG